MLDLFCGRWASGLAALALASLTGSAHATYLSLFNEEGASDGIAAYVTYATLDDMLNDTNRVTTAQPDGHGASGNSIVGAGSDGSIYWSLFNMEGTTSCCTAYVTYATLDDMIKDTNRLTTTQPDGHGASGNSIVGSGSDRFGSSGGGGGNVPEPTTVALISLGLAGIGFVRNKK